jgi:RNA polymerase sigma-70 factor (ECF subfamily)
VDTDPSQQLDDAALMQAALSALAGPDREALMLVAWEGLDNEGASRVLGITPQAFAVRLHRARRRLETEVSRLTALGAADVSPKGDR